jgi:3-deoxy-D-manno-octulosonic-acid transferase
VNRQTYSFLLLLLSPLIWLYLIWRAIKAPEYRSGWLQRLGFVKPVNGSTEIVVHCASVGEAQAAIPLIKKLILQYSANKLVLSTTTPTGKKILTDAFIDESNITIVYLPIDWLGCCRRFLNRLSPKVLVLMETELWPNLLHACGQKNIAVMLANARLSDKSYKKYAQHPKLTQAIFSKIHLIAAQYESDRQRFIALGVAENKVKSVGSIKFDIQLAEILKQQQQALKAVWTISQTSKKNRPVWLAASIHPAEFESILSVHKGLLKKIPDLLLIAVPRHPEKFELLKSQVKASTLSYINRSDYNKLNAKAIGECSLNDSSLNDSTQMVIGDTMGELLLFCGLADVSYVGGSLIERGGHNPLEPIACGSPVIMGQHIFNFSDVCQILQDEKVLDLVKNEVELETRLELLLTNVELRQKRSRHALKVMQKHAGCVDKMLTQIEQLANG